MTNTFLPTNFKKAIFYALTLFIVFSYEAFASRAAFIESLRNNTDGVRTQFIADVNRVANRDTIIANIQRDHSRQDDWRDNDSSYFYASSNGMINALIDYAFANYEDAVVKSADNTVTLFVTYRGTLADVVPEEYRTRDREGAIGRYAPKSVYAYTTRYAIAIGIENVDSADGYAKARLLTGFPARP
jgi:hypothetical protein